MTCKGKLLHSCAVILFEPLEGAVDLDGNLRFGFISSSGGKDSGWNWVNIFFFRALPPPPQLGPVLRRRYNFFLAMQTSISLRMSAILTTKRLRLKTKLHLDKIVYLQRP